MDELGRELRVEVGDTTDELPRIAGVGLVLALVLGLSLYRTRDP